MGTCQVYGKRICEVKYVLVVWVSIGTLSKIRMDIFTMSKKVTTLLITTLFALAFTCYNANYGYSQNGLNDNNVEGNISYSVKRTEPISETVAKNISYKIRPYDPKAQENSKYELVKFTNGENSDEEASITNISIGKLNDNPSVKSAVFFLQSPSGGTATETQLCIASDNGNEYHINQAIILFNKYDRVKSIQIKNNEIILRYFSTIEASKSSKIYTTKYRLNNDKIEKIK